MTMRAIILLTQPMGQVDEAKPYPYDLGYEIQRIIHDSLRINSPDLRQAARNQRRA